MMDNIMAHVGRVSHDRTKVIKISRVAVVIECRRRETQIVEEELTGSRDVIVG
jgi:hypothetical protein